MKVKYIGDYYKVVLHKGGVYEVLSIENGWYELIDDMNDSGFFPPGIFEIIEE